MQSNYQMICTSSNYWSVFGYIGFKVLYFINLFLLSVVLRQTRNTNERPFYRPTEAFVL